MKRIPTHTTIRLSPLGRVQLARLAKRLGITRSAVIRLAIDRLDQSEKGDRHENS